MSSTIKITCTAPSIGRRDSKTYTERVCSFVPASLPSFREEMVGSNRVPERGDRLLSAYLYQDVCDVCNFHHPMLMYLSLRCSGSSLIGEVWREDDILWNCTSTLQSWRTSHLFPPARRVGVRVYYHIIIIIPTSLPCGRRWSGTQSSIIVTHHSQIEFDSFACVFW